MLFLATINDVLMERHLAGHNLVWWAAWLGVLLAISRSLIGEDTPVFDPEEAMAKVDPTAPAGRLDGCITRQHMPTLTTAFPIVPFLPERTY